MKKLYKVLTATAVSAALASGIGFAQVGPQGPRGQGFRQGRPEQHFGHKGGPRGFGTQGGIFRKGGPRGFGQTGPLGKIAHLSQGSTITASFYGADPSTGAAPTSTLSLVVGVNSEMTFMKSFKELAETANFIVINTGPQSRTIELNKEKVGNIRRRRAEDKVALMLSHLNLNSTVTASFYNANPSDGGAALTTLSFVAGQDSEMAFKNAFEAAAANAGWVTINTSAQEHTINVADFRARRAEMQNKIHEHGFGPGFGRRQGHKPGQ